MMVHHPERDDKRVTTAPDDRPHSRACGIRNHEHGPDCHSNCPTCHGQAPQPESVRKRTRPTNDRFTLCQACKQGCQECGGTGSVPVEMTGTAGLTWGEQQQALLLLRYWHEAYRGGLEPTPTVHLMTELLLAAHPART